MSSVESARPGLSAWRLVTVFGVISLLADFVYDGARSITGPLLVIGPLTVAGMLVATNGDFAPALGVLALPGAATLALLAWLRLRVPHPESYEAPAVGEFTDGHAAQRFWHCRRCSGCIAGSPRSP